MMIKKITLLTTLMSLSLAGCATFYDEDRYVKAQVLSVQKLDDLCNVKGDGHGGKVALGAILGGLIGNQFGQGSGNKVATVGGDAAGAVITDQAIHEKDAIHCKSQGYMATVRYLHPKTGKHTMDKVALDEYTDTSYLMVPFN